MAGLRLWSSRAPPSNQHSPVVVFPQSYPRFVEDRAHSKSHPFHSSYALPSRAGRCVFRDRELLPDSGRRIQQNAKAHTWLGWVLLSNGQVDASISHFRTALRLNPNLSDADVNLAGALAKKGGVSSAIDAARDAVRLAPQSAASHRVLGRSLSFAGQLDDAIAEMQRALQLEADNPELHDELGALLGIVGLQ